MKDDCNKSLVKKEINLVWPVGGHKGRPKKQNPIGFHKDNGKKKLNVGAFSIALHFLPNSVSTCYLPFSLFCLHCFYFTFFFIWCKFLQLVRRTKAGVGANELYERTKWNTNDTMGVFEK
jgi:hypothetical protein